MKAAIIFTIFLSLANYCFASEIVSPGMVEDFDVLGKNPITFDVTSLGSLKSVRVTEEYSGFECFVEEIKDGKMVSISWGPGADSSGCTVEIQGTKGSAKLMPYMSY